MNEAPELWYLGASYAVAGGAMLAMLAPSLWRVYSVKKRLAQLKE